MVRTLAVLSMLAPLLVPFAALGGNTPAPANARAYFVDLKDGDKVSNPIKVVFGVSGLEIVPAGTDKPNAGHFHLLIDTTLSPEEQKFAIPNDAQHQHFGKGQTETTLTLPPGRHTLQLVMGDAKHELHDHPVMSPVITITVQ